MTTDDIKTDFKQTALFTLRNIKLFFKNKGAFMSALISPIIILVLYVLFLHRIYLQLFGDFALPEKLINGIVASYEVSSVMSVICITVAFVVNMNMVADKVGGIRADFDITPVKGRVLVLGYYFATFISTAAISGVTLAAGLCYVAAMGWSMTFGQTVAVIGDMLLATMFGTALSSVVCCLLKSNGAMSAVSTVVSSVYGFICGAYYPISQFTPAIANTVMCLPGTYFTALFRTHFSGCYAAELVGAGVPTEAVNELLGGLDFRLEFFGIAVEQWAMYTVAIATVIATVVLFVLMNALLSKRRKVKA